MCKYWLLIIESLLLGACSNMKYVLLSNFCLARIVTLLPSMYYILLLGIQVLDMCSSSNLACTCLKYLVGFDFDQPDNIAVYFLQPKQLTKQNHSFFEYFEKESI